MGKTGKRCKETGYVADVSNSATDTGPFPAQELLRGRRDFSLGGTGRLALGKGDRLPVASVADLEKQEACGALPWRRGLITTQATLSTGNFSRFLLTLLRRGKQPGQAARTPTSENVVSRTGLHAANVLFPDWAEP